LSVRDPSLTLTQFCARLKTVLFCRAYETLARTHVHLLTYLLLYEAQHGLVSRV